MREEPRTMEFISHSIPLRTTKQIELKWPVLDILKMPTWSQNLMRMRHKPLGYHVHLKSKTFLRHCVPNRQSIFVQEPRQGPKSRNAHAPTDPIWESLLPVPKIMEFTSLAVLVPPQRKCFPREHSKNPIEL